MKIKKETKTKKNTLRKQKQKIFPCDYRKRKKKHKMKSKTANPLTILFSINK
jgi:hypothetical protein